MDTAKGLEALGETLEEQVKAFCYSAPPLYFLKAGYAVIFLYRNRSFQPFYRSLPDDPLLECFKPTDESNIQVCEAYSEAVKRAVVDHHTVVAVAVDVTNDCNVNEDNWPTGNVLSCCCSVEPKIQLGSHLLDVKLVQVPKMLSVLRKDWTPQAFCISFKLETDSNILLNKAGAALGK
ncbi:hypothetical protein VNO78_28773 [Psophocarpus tetragonolobus]|uniref:Uncharacterized protein n=1 Tax=Psophocarpus tetragonolobus TaxID=3891 RepID=A0AAN9RTR4_PSOTE